LRPFEGVIRSTPGAWRTPLAFGAYALLCLASFYPQSLSPGDTVAYIGDSLESVYIVAWNVHQFFRSPLHLFDANVFFPEKAALAFTDHRLLPSLIVAPIVWSTGNPVLAYNAAVALGCLLAAFAARHLAGALGCSTLGAWAGGALYAFHTYQVNEAPRLNIIFHAFLPLALGQLVLFLTTGEAKRAWATAGFMLLQGLSSNYHLLYGALLLGLVTLGTAVVRPLPTLRRLPVLVLAAAVAALLFAPVVWPYLRVSQAHGFVRGLPEGIDLEHYFSTSPRNLLYGAIGTEVRLQQRGPHFIGFASLLLATVALMAALFRRGTDPKALLAVRCWVPSAGALALVMVALSLGRDLVVFGHRLGPGPYRLLYHFVPGFQLVRIPERFSLLAMLFVALLVARALTLVGELGPGKGLVRGFLLVLTVLVPLEHVSALPTSQRVPVGSAVPQVYRWLQANAVAGLAEVPIRGEGLVREETVEMYFSTYHFKPLIHGYTAFPPLITRILRRVAAQFPSEGSLQVLQRAGVDTVVVHRGREEGSDLDRQVTGWGEQRRRRLERLLRAARLDLYEQLPEARAAGRIELLAHFEGEGARLFQSEGDEVYRILPAPAWPAAPFPKGKRARSPAWRYRTKPPGDPMPAVDGDLSTSWVVNRPLNGDEFFEIRFDRPIRVAGLVLPLRRDSVFPTRFRIGGRSLEEHWFEIARFDDAHALQLLEQLRTDPAHAALGFDLEGRDLTGVSLLMEEGGTSFEGWSLPEVEVWVP